MGVVITSRSHPGKPDSARGETKAHQGGVALPRYTEQVAKAGGDRWHGLEGAAVSPLGLWGEALPSPILCLLPGRSWGSEAALADGILQRKRARREGCPQPANLS